MTAAAPGEGAVLGLIARRADRLAEVLAECRKTSSDSRMWVADLAETASVGDLGSRAWDELGGIDVLVNNAAMPKRRRVDALDPAEVEDVMRVNFVAPMRLTLAVLPRMLQRGHGFVLWGHTIHEAYMLAFLVIRACETQVLAGASGRGRIHRP